MKNGLSCNQNYLRSGSLTLFDYHLKPSCQDWLREKGINFRYEYLPYMTTDTYPDKNLRYRTVVLECSEEELIEFKLTWL